MSEHFGAWVDQVMSVNAKGDFRVVGVLKPSWINHAEAAQSAPVTATVIVRDHDVKHSFRDAKSSQLPLDWYRNLPEHLCSPQAVLMDLTKPAEPAFLLLYGLQKIRSYKLVLRINYSVKISGQIQLVNCVTTGHAANLTGLKGKVGKELRLIESSL